MADPTIQTFCCHRRERVDAAVHLMNAFNRDSYLIISIVSSSIGILGALYQIFIRKSHTETSTNRSAIGRRIIVFLAWSDLFASMGICLRSTLWSFVRQILPYYDDNKSVLFCSISSAFIQVFYTATWLWTLIYALNMRKALRNQPVRERDYHIFVWSVSILLTSIGTTTLYYPDADCHAVENFTTVLLRVMPNYFFNYGPIICVMIINPIIYFQCSKEVDRQLIQRFGQYTNNERQVHDLFKIKFSLINLIFYVCWLPNIINAILMWTMWYELTRTSTIGKIVVINWYIIAILNPLQALFNAFVYRKWNEGIVFCESLRKWFSEKFTRRQREGNDTEQSPLLLSTTRIPRNYDDNFHKYSIQCPLV